MTSLVTGSATLDPYEYASDLVRGYTGLSFTAVAGDTVILDPRPDGTVQLPQVPVTAVTAADGWMPGPDGVWDWQPLAYRWIPRGLLYNTAHLDAAGTARPEPSWPWVPGSLRITYNHGFASVPTEIQDVVTRLAGQIAANPYWVQSRKVGEVSAVFGTNGALGLRDSDRAILDRYAVSEVS